MECKSKFARIVVGSKAEFNLILKANGKPFDLTPFSGGNLVFLNTAGTRTVVPLTIPGLSPANGIVAVEIDATDSANADSKWVNADLELTATIVADSRVIPLSNAFEIVKRNAPPVGP